MSRGRYLSQFLGGIADHGLEGVIGSLVAMILPKKGHAKYRVLQQRLPAFLAGSQIDLQVIQRPLSAECAAQSSASPLGRGRATGTDGPFARLSALASCHAGPCRIHRLRRNPASLPALWLRGTSIIARRKSARTCEKWQLPRSLARLSARWRRSPMIMTITWSSVRSDAGTSHRPIAKRLELAEAASLARGA